MLFRSLTLTGTNFTGTNGLNLAQGSDAKSYLNWDNFVWKANGTDGASSDVVFSADDILSATLTNSTTMTVTVSSSANSTLKSTSGFAAQGTADGIVVTEGFIKDVAGNASETDAATITQTYGDNSRPTVTSFTTTAVTGSYGKGAKISITATTSEAVAAGGTLTATFGFGGTVVLTAASSGTELTGTYTVAAGVSTTSLSVSSFTTTATDLYGNTLQTTVPTGAVFAGKTIAIDTAAPATTITAVEYADNANGTGTLTLTGTNFTGTNGLNLAQGSDAKS